MWFLVSPNVVFGIFWFWQSKGAIFFSHHAEQLDIKTLGSFNCLLLRTDTYISSTYLYHFFKFKLLHLTMQPNCYCQGCGARKILCSLRCGFNSREVTCFWFWFHLQTKCTHHSTPTLTAAKWSSSGSKSLLFIKSYMALVPTSESWEVSCLWLWLP